MEAGDYVGLLFKTVVKVLSKLNVDSSGRLRVAAESVANMSTLSTLTTCSTVTTCSAVTAVTNISNWGAGVSPQSYAQLDSRRAYAGYRANIAKS